MSKKVDYTQFERHAYRVAQAKRQKKPKTFSELIRSLMPDRKDNNNA